MIRKPNNWDNVQASGSSFPKVPLGAYVCQIIQVNQQSTSNGGTQLCVLFDIVEGEYKKFYERDFASSTIKDKKWKGVLRVWLPKYDDSEDDNKTIANLKGFTTSVEDSNVGYTWNWEEKSLKGKTVGIMYRNEEWDYNGKTGWSAKPFIAMAADRVRSGDFVLPKDKPLHKEETHDNLTDLAAFANTKFAPAQDDDDGELPF